ncbi:hypothetical protein F5883DRAFT_238097 [Diaporthe sp. PMI_573]|nr:hypothetical protein F5883DRAFT_238097 [Diaporthaceae sp. PMI_573]
MSVISWRSSCSPLVTSLVLQVPLLQHGSAHHRPATSRWATPTSSAAREPGQPHTTSSPSLGFNLCWTGWLTLAVRPVITTTPSRQVIYLLPTGSKRPWVCSYP